MSIQQRARRYPCTCGAEPGELCLRTDGQVTYNVHVNRLEQENDAWKQAHVDSEGEVIGDIPQTFLEPER